MRDAGMTVHVDAAGNIAGRFFSSDSVTKRNIAPRTLIFGSHLDTVPNGGAFDGVLGVLIGLAVAEHFSKPESTQLPFAIDVIGFSEEEGVRFAQPYLGSAAIAGLFDSAWLDRTDDQGISVSQAISDFGLSPQNIADAAVDPSTVIGFIEAHIEQGPVLESAGQPIGVVSSIIGQTRLVVEFLGVAGHAGTTPMTPRHDALVTAGHWIHEVNRTALSIDGIRATVGRINVWPNASNVIPGRVEASLDVRHAADDVRERSVAQFLALAALIAQNGGAGLSVKHRSDVDSVCFSKRLETLMCDAIDATTGTVVRLPSGAGHDAAIMAKRFPTSMLFVRHPGGISHHPDERVDASDVGVAIDTLIDLVNRLAAQEIS